MSIRTLIDSILPDTTGHSGEVLTVADAVGNLEWAAGGGGSGITELTGAVTAGPGTGSQVASIAANAVTTAKILDANVTLAKLANVADSTFLGNNTGGAAAPLALTVAQAKMLLSLSGSNTGDQTITLTGNVTGSGTGSFATTIAAGVVTLAMQASLAANSIVGNNTGSPATPLALTVAQVKTLLNLTGTNGGDVTLTTIGSSPNANAASLSGQQLQLQPADGSFGGVVTTASQTFAGVKTFASVPLATGLTGSGSSSLTLKGAGANSNGVVGGCIFDTSTLIDATGAKVHSFRNNGTEIAYFDNANGLLPASAASYQCGNSSAAWLLGAFDNVYTSTVTTRFETGSAYLSLPIGAGMLTLQGYTADGASAVSTTLNAATALTTAGARIVSFRNGGTEKAAIDLNGRVIVDYGTASSGSPVTINKPSGKATWTGTGANNFTVNNSLVTATSVVLCQLEVTGTGVGSMTKVNPGAGSFTVQLNANQTAGSTRVAFVVFNL